MNILKNKKFRYGSVSVALTVVIIAAVILLNAIVTALVGKYNLYLDMTEESLFTLSTEAKTLLEPIKENNRRVKVIFCAAEDEAMADSHLRYALQTVRDIEEYMGSTHVVREHVDIFKSPQLVQGYFDLESTDIPSTYHIILVGQTRDEKGEWVDGYSQVYYLAALFTYDSTGSEIIGYNGEQRLVSGMLSVTQTEQPIAYITSNHGELDSLRGSASSSPFEVLLQDCGFKVETLDLTTQEIHEDASLIVIYNPTSDLVIDETYSGVNEVTKLETFLDQGHSLMVFVDNTTGLKNGTDGRLDNLEDFLSYWGIGIARQSLELANDANLLLQANNKDTGDASGHNIQAEYVTGGLGASVTKKLREKTVLKPVWFAKSTALINTYDEFKYYENDGDSYYEYRSDEDYTTRRCYDVFLSPAGTKGMVNNEVVQTAGSGLNERFSLMKLTRETLGVNDSGSERYAYVMACASTQFVTALGSAYGNHSVLTRACHEMGATNVSVSIDPKYFTDTEIDDMTAGVANRYTIALTVIPAGLIFIAGIYIMVRRKYR